MTLHNQPANNQNHLIPSLDEPTPSDSLTPLHDLISASRLVAYQTNLTHISPQPVHWLWQKRIPLAGITLLDGDHLLGKTLLAHQIAAAVSSGSPMPDGTPTIQGNVILITPHTDHTTTQLQQLIALGANLNHIEFLSFVPQSISSSNPLAPDAHPSQWGNDEAYPIAPLADVSAALDTSQSLGASHTATTRSFCLPEDLTLLHQTIERVNPRLVIFDPFIALLSRTKRITNERLCHLLSDLNLYFIERNIASLLIRNCPARGGHARPSVLERSDHFLTTAASRLLLTPDPFLPDRLLLCHALSRHAALTPTLIFHFQPYQHNSDLARFTFLASHTLQARDFIENRPDTLHRRLLSQHLLNLLRDSANVITDTKVIHVSTLKSHCPNSSPFQIQRSLNDLLNMGQIERPARGLYTPVSPDSVSPSNTTAAIPSTLDTTCILNSTTATTYPPEPPNHLNSTATTAPTSEPTHQPNPSATTPPIYEPTHQLNSTAATTHHHIVSSTLNSTAAITPIPNLTSNLNSTATTTPASAPPNQPDPTATTTHHHIVSSMLNATAETTLPSQPTNPLNATAATTFIPDPRLTNHLSPAEATLYNQVLEANWRMTYMDEPRDITLAQEMQRRKNFWNVDYGD